LFFGDFSMPLRKFSLSAGAFYYSAGKIELVDALGSAETVSALEDSALMLGLSREAGKGIRLGGNLKFFHSVLVDEFSASAALLDTGVLYMPKNAPLNFGLLLQNFSTGLKYHKEKETTQRKAVFSLLWGNSPVSIMANLIKPQEENMKLSFGAEFSVRKDFLLRAGFKNASDIGSVSFGFGLPLPGFILNYSFMPCEIFESVHNIEIKYLFREKGKPALIPRRLSVGDMEEKGAVKGTKREGTKRAAVIPFVFAGGKEDKRFFESVKESLLKTGYEVVVPSGESAFLDNPSAGEVIETGKKFDVARIVTGRVRVLGENFVITLNMFETKNGAKIYSRDIFTKSGKIKAVDFPE